jgi:hypothetical protein
MTKKKPIFLFDMDCSLFDYQGAMVSELNKLANNDNEIITNKANLWHLDTNPLFEDKINKIKATPGFWKNLPPIELGFKVYELAKNLNFKIEILTKGPRRFPNAWAEKLECGQIHFGPKINVNVVSSKHLFRGEILYDDFPSYLSAWMKYNPESIGIMPVNSTNTKYFNKNLLRLEDTNFDEIATKVTLFKERFEC